jgi:NAD(P)H dehydrogenase (quinone)
MFFYFLSIILALNGTWYGGIPTMRIMVIIDHPWAGSFNHAIYKTVILELRSAGHEVDELDLHLEQFNPVMRVEELAVYAEGRYLDPKVGGYQARIDKAEYLFLVFPVWWEGLPALLKGFFDKVFLPGWAFAEADFSPLLTHVRGATVITTMGAPKAVHTSVEPACCKGTLEACGVGHARWINFLDVGHSTPEQRALWLAQAAESTRELG